MQVDMNEGAMRHVMELLDDVRYDLCVLTGDYRDKTFGPFDVTLDGIARVRAYITGAVYGTRQSRHHPAMEIRMLLNECNAIVRVDQLICLAGIDDAHYAVNE
jgi:uncharacterized protein